MSTTEQPEALRLADAMERFTKSSHWWTDGEPIHIAVAAELRRLQSENDTLRAGYDAARLEIESLQAQTQQCGAGAGCCAQAARIEALEAQLDAVGAGGAGRLVPDVSLINQGDMPAAQALDAARVFWQQHTQSAALNMTMAELHVDVERVIRAALAAPSQAATAKQSPHPEYDKGFSDGWNRCEARQAAAPAQAGEYPELPPLQVRYDGLGHTTTMGYGASQMRDYADATCAARKAALAAPAQPLHVAAINCPHEIDKDRVVLHYDSKQPGKNALAQLAARLQAAQAQLDAVGAVPDGMTHREFGQFLSDVLTAAGLVSHGGQSKGLGQRLADAVMRLRAAPQPAAQALDDIIGMAREVGAPGWWTGETDSNVPGRDWLSRFAALVAAAERRACTAACEKVKQQAKATANSSFVADAGKDVHNAMAAGAQSCIAAIAAQQGTNAS